jgi:outer membrane protein assembly factor BamB
LGLKILWQRDIGYGFSNVVIKDGRLYAMGKQKSNNIVLCLNSETGEEIWQHSFNSSREPQCTPVTDGKVVVALGYRGELLCLNAEDGTLRWNWHLIDDLGAEKLQYGFGASPIVDGDLLILNVNTAGMALDIDTGEMLWTSERHKNTDWGYYATPVIYDRDGQRCALLFNATGLVSVEVQTGRKLWAHKRFRSAHSSADPVFFEDRAFISIGEGAAKGALLDIAGDEAVELWDSENLRNGFSSSVYLDGYLYGADGGLADISSSLRCIDAETSDLVWEKQMEIATLISANGKLIVLEQHGMLHVVEATPTAFVEISSVKLPIPTVLSKWWTPPVLYRGKVYCRNEWGDLICLDVGE